MLKNGLIGVCLAALVTVASLSPAVAKAADAAVSPAAEQIVRQAIKGLSASVHVDSIAPAPMPGFYQVIAGGQMVYVSADGKYLMHGELVDLSRHKNLNEDAWARFRKQQLAKVPASQRIIYAAAHPKYTITVFTDVNCGFCRKLHEHIAAFNQAGITVEYLAWPREGVTTTAGRPTRTYTEMVSAWCAPDRKAAFTAATQGHAPKPATCANPIKDQFALGLKLGVNGTPAVYGPDGRVLGGYVTPAQLLRALSGG